jgi:uncharacterized protein YqcC (DUF446 family)
VSPLLWHELADALLELELALRGSGLWSKESPEPFRLASEAPFCVDTLDFEQWLQWVFIPRMAEIIAAGESLPGAFRIAPMAEEAFAHLGRRGDTLVAVLSRIDGLAARIG